MNIGKFISIIHRTRQLYIKKRIKEMELKISISDYPIILALNSRGVLGVTEIAKDYALTKAQVSKSIIFLEKMKYVVIMREIKSLNRVNVEITDEGKKIAEKLRLIQREWQEKNILNVEKNRFGVFCNVLEEIFNNINKGSDLK